MKTRCKPGDLAVIVREEPGCKKNIGKIVEVRGPIRMSETKGPQWVIRSMNTRGHWFVRRPKSGLIVRLYRGLRWDHDVDHPDAWMVPIMGPTGEARFDTQHGTALPSHRSVEDHATMTD